MQKSHPTMSDFGFSMDSFTVLTALQGHTLQHKVHKAHLFYMIPPNLFLSACNKQHIWLKCPQQL